MTQKYYIGQKVMWDNSVDTISTVLQIKIDDDLETYLYVVDRYRDGVGYGEFKEDYLQRPPAKLEYGYCAIGDIVVDEGGMEHMILDVREKVIVISRWNFDEVGLILTYKETRNNRFKIKQEEPTEDIVELTLEDVAKLKGISVDKLRIKE